MKNQLDCRILQVTGSTRVDYGGTSRSVPALCEALAGQGADVHLVTERPGGVRFITPSPPVVTHLVDPPKFFRRLMSGKGVARQLKKIFPQSKRGIVHDHGIWIPPNHAVARLAKSEHWIRIVSPRGMVSRWALAHGSPVKRIAWTLYQKRDLFDATAFHATSGLEADELREIGLRQPIAVIPNGVDFPDTLPRRQSRGGKKRMLFLSRIHPKKGLVHLVNAWQKAGLSGDWELLLVGPDEGGHRGEVEAEIARCDVGSSVHVLDQVSDTEKWQQLVDADLFVLPSFSENFGIVVAEALSAGIPVITTTGTPWQCLTTKRLGWCVEPTVDELAVAIIDACRLPDQQRREMGQRGAEWAGEQFQWTHVGQQMLEFYQWLLGGGDRPECVLQA